jgi:hypothetical protein
MKTRKAIVPAAVLLALPLILYAPFLFGGKVLYWGVYLLQFYPWRQLAVEQIRAGHWPLWNPYLGAGTPLAANLQTAAFYPPNVLLLLMPVERAFGWELVLHVALAGLFAYYLGRTLGLSRFGALIVGLAYGGGGYIISRWVFPSMVYAAAWLPLMLALTERLISHRSFKSQSPGSKAAARIRYWMLDIALLALIIALQLLAGHAQTSFYSAVIVAAFALFRLAQQRTPVHESRIRSSILGIGSLLLAALWGIALAAIQLLPTAELTTRSHRAGSLTDLTFAYELSFWPWRLITLLAPDFFGNPARDEYWAYGTYWEESAFVGVLPLILALAALAGWLSRRRREGNRETLAMVPFFFLLSLLSLILAMGNHTPLYPLLFRYVPGFGLFQAPARLMMGYALGMALLAGIGAETLRLTPRTRTALRITIVAGMGMAIAGAAARIALPAVHASFGDSMLRLGLTLALAAVVLLLQGRRLRRTRWQALVIVLVVADLLAFGWGLASGTDPSVYRNPVATAEFLTAQPPGRSYVDNTYAGETYNRYVSLSAHGSADPAHLQGLRESLFPNLNSVHHLLGVGNYDPLAIGLYRDLYDILEGQPDTLAEARPVLNLFAARYIITENELELPLLYDTGPRIYANNQALPATFVVHQTRVIEDREARLGVLRDPGFDPRSEVILSRSPSVALSRSANRVEGEQPSISREGPDRVVIEARLSEPGYLVLADTYYPGWRATVDGEPIEILPANHAFRAVQLDRGEHTVVFEYAPLSFRLGAWITLGAILLLATTLSIVVLLRGREYFRQRGSHQRKAEERHNDRSNG